MVLPAFAPAVDILAVYGLFFLDTATVAASWLAFMALQGLGAAYALRLDRERLRWHVIRRTGTFAGNPAGDGVLPAEALASEARP